LLSSAIVRQYPLELVELSEISFKITGLVFDFILPEGKDCKFPLPSGFSGVKFCHLISTESTACRSSVLEAISKAAQEREIQVYTCPAGLVDFVIPIYWQGKILGFISSGQILTSPPTEKKFKERLSFYRSIKVDLPSLKRSYFEVKVISAEELKEKIEIMKFIATYGLEKLIDWKLRDEIKNSPWLQREEKEILGYIIHHYPFNFHQNFLFKQLISHNFKVILLGGKDLLTPPRLERYSLTLNQIINFIKGNFKLSSYIWPDFSPGRIIILVKGSHRNEVSQFQKIQQKIAEKFSLKLNLSAGTLYSFKNIFFSYAQAHRSFNYFLLTQDTPFFSAKPPLFLLAQPEEKKDIMWHFRNNNGTLFQKALLQFLLEKFWSFPSRLKFFLMEKMIAFDKEIQKILTPLERKIPSLSSGVATLLLKNTPAQVYNYFKKLANDYLNLYAKARQDVKRNTVEKIKSIIEEDYRREDVYQKISAETPYQRNYLCYLFKNQTGQTLTDYLTRVRINKAKELLKETSLSISEITFEVGYQNFSSFYRAFKKLEKISPSEFRKSSHS
jgi:AraC-like DNA-binding protein/ligand-binding sensor protein